MFEVLTTNRENEVRAKVIQGGPLKSKKGVNLPNTNISLPALTEKDIEDAIFAISLHVDWIALSSLLLIRISVVVVVAVN